MYEAKLTIDGVTLALNHSNGYDIARIDGMTAITTDIKSSVRNEGIGEEVKGTTIKGKTLTIKGYILDGATAKKNDLIACALPKGKGTLAVKVTAGSYYATEVWVKSSPTISQEKHSAFTLTLFAPNPTWRPETDYAREVRLANGSTVNLTVGGHFDCEYSFNCTTSGDTLNAIALILDNNTANQKTIGMDFDSALAAGTVIRLYREDGILRLTVNGNDAIGALDIESTFWYLPKGAHTIRAILYGGDNIAGSMSVSWVQRYAGAMVYGT